MKPFVKIVLLSLIILLVASCSTTRTIPAGDALYTGAKLKISGKNLTRKETHAFDEDLEKLTRPENLSPNPSRGYEFRLIGYG